MTSDLLVRILRGGIEESTHRGAFVLVEDGRVSLSRGHPERVVFYRSASKPLQALELVLSGAADAFGLSPSEIAIAAGSHSGEPRHLETVRSLLRKADVPESALRCGGHRSINPEIAFAQRRDSTPVTSILSNCSGKHAGMLAAARHRGEPLDGYMDIAHPVQQAIVDHVAAFCGIDRTHVAAGVDGCGAPALAVPLDAMAFSIARIADPDGPATGAGGGRLRDDLAAAARRVAAAMLASPEMVAGEGRFDTDLMLAGRGAILAKAGAEGVHVTALPGRRTALAIKVDDGSDRGYRPVVLSLLARLGALDGAAFASLSKKHALLAIPNMAGREVGRVEVLP
jgi:L-asparaginase II